MGSSPIASTLRCRSLLYGFAYLANLRGDEGRAQELLANTQPFGASMIFGWLRLVPFGATAQDALERWAQISETDPAAGRFARDAQHGQGFIAQELERWS